MKYNFEEMLHNEEVQKIGYKAANKFRRQLSKDEIDGCFMVALWQACDKYNPDYDPTKIASFFTFFYKGVLFECMKLCKTNSNFKENLKKIKYGNNLNKIKIAYEEKSFSDIDAQDLGLNEKDTKVIIDLFWKNKNIRELSQENNISQPAMKKRIDKILKSAKVSRV